MAADATVNDTKLCVSVVIGNSPPAAKVTLKSEEGLSDKAVLIGIAQMDKSELVVGVADPEPTVRGNKLKKYDLLLK